MGRLSDHLRDLRQSLGITQQELAERAQISQARISQIERGYATRPVPRRTLTSLADALGVGIAALIGGDPLYDDVDLGDVALNSALPPGLPPLSVSLVGRELDLSTLLAWLDQEDVRLITLTGPGGVGKTLLALHTAQAAASRFDAVTVVSLASCTNAAQIVSMVARAIGVRERDERPIRERLLSALRATRRLLLLDNVEQALPSAARVVAELVEACPQLTVLATSRRALRIDPEHEYRVEPLALPDCSWHGGEGGERTPAVELFLQRATAFSTQLTFTPETIASIAEIVRHLDGLPLAIELAAVRSKTIPPREMLRRFPSRLMLLNRGPLDLPTRQRSLKATIAWSCDLLSEDRRALLRRLSVFEGGFSVDAVAAMLDSAAGNGRDHEDGAVGDDLADLAEHNLLTRSGASDGTIRYGMLETIHEYAREQLVLAGEAAEWHARHLHWFLALAQQAKRTLFTAGDAPWLARLEQENTNLHVALTWAFGAGRSTHLEAGLLLVSALDDYWYVSGRLTEGRTWLSRGIALSDTEPPTIGRARCLAGAALIEQTQAATEPAERHGQQGLRLAQELDDGPALGRSLLVLANLAMMRKDFARARQLYEEALTCLRRLGDQPSIAITLINLGVLCRRQQQLDAAMTYAEDALRIVREIGDRWDEIAAHRLLGEVFRDRGQLVQAESHFVTGLDLAWQHGSGRDVANALSAMSTIAIAAGDLERAARYLGAAERLYRQLGIEIPPPTRPDWAEIVSQLKRDLAADRFAQVWESTSPPQAVRELVEPVPAAG